MKNNIAHLIKQELVNQFENVVKNEIRSHEKSVESTNNSLRDLKVTFESLQSELGKIKAQSEHLYLETLKKFIEEKDEIKDSFEEQRRFIKESSKKLDKSLSVMEENIENAIDVEIFMEWKDHTMEMGASIYKKIEEKFETLSSEIHKSYCENRSYIHSHVKNCEDENSKIREELCELRADLEVHKVDSVGVLRELQVYKKTMFIMEKKIENLYNKLDKIQKRVEVCPNPV